MRVLTSTAELLSSDTQLSKRVKRYAVVGPLLSSTSFDTTILRFQGAMHMPNQANDLEILSSARCA